MTIYELQSLHVAEYIYLFNISPFIKRIYEEVILLVQFEMDLLCVRIYGVMCAIPCNNHISTCIWLKYVSFRFAIFTVPMIFKSCLAQFSFCLTIYSITNIWAFNIFFHTEKHRRNFISYISCMLENDFVIQAHCSVYMKRLNNNKIHFETAPKYQTHW